MREAFAASLIFFNKKYWHILDINVCNFNETLTNDVVSFEQPGPEKLSSMLFVTFLSNKTLTKKSYISTKIEAVDHLHAVFLLNEE